VDWEDARSGILARDGRLIDVLQVDAAQMFSKR
jgi:hypothetical protein